jgi:hypothetical protein
VLEQQDRPGAGSVPGNPCRDPFCSVDPPAAGAALSGARQQPQLALEQLLIVRSSFLQCMQAGNQIGLLYLHMNQWQQADRGVPAADRHREKGGSNHYFLALALIGQSHYQAAIEQLQQVNPATMSIVMPCCNWPTCSCRKLVERGPVVACFAGTGNRRQRGLLLSGCFLSTSAGSAPGARFATDAQRAPPRQDARLLYQQGVVLYEALDGPSAPWR